MKDNARVKYMKDLRTQGLTYEEIGKEMGLSRQRVYQLIGGYTNHSVVIRPEQCIYPAIRFWLIENNISISGLTRIICGYAHPEKRYVLSSALKGANCTKNTIDNILKATGLTYEVAFRKE